MSVRQEEMRDFTKLFVDFLKESGAEFVVKQNTISVQYAAGNLQIELEIFCGSKFFTIHAIFPFVVDAKPGQRHFETLLNETQRLPVGNFEFVRDRVSLKIGGYVPGDLTHEVMGSYIGLALAIAEERGALIMKKLLPD